MTFTEGMQSLIGTYPFRLTGCWGSRNVTGAGSTTKSISIQRFHNLETIPTIQPLISVLMFRHRSSDSLTPYYICKVGVSSQKPKRSIVRSYRNALKLYCRFMSTIEEGCAGLLRPLNQRCPDASSSTQKNDPPHSEDAQMFWTERDAIMPGQQNKRFLFVLHNNLQHKYESYELFDAWIVSSDLYAVWACTSFISVELFADCINESGALLAYCSADDKDSEFGAVGDWMAVESKIEGAGGNPPLDPTFICKLLNEFERGIRREKPYCKCVLLPLGARYGVLNHLNSICSEGILLVSIGAGALPFKSQLELLSIDSRKPKSYGSQNWFTYLAKQTILAKVSHAS